MNKYSFRFGKLTLGCIVLPLVSFYFLKILTTHFMSDEAFLNQLTVYINRYVEVLENNDYTHSLKTKWFLFTYLNIRNIEIDEERSIFIFQRKNVYYAIKRVKSNFDVYYSEDNISKRLWHKNIVKIYNVFSMIYKKNNEYERVVWIIMEKMDIDLTDYDLSAREIQQVFSDVCAGLKYLHGQYIAHLDIKIDNIMGKYEDGQIVYKIIDFGFARDLKKYANNEIFLPRRNYGSFPYKPPEVFFDNIHSLKADIWCLGLVLLYLYDAESMIQCEVPRLEYILWERFLNNFEVHFDYDIDYDLEEIILACINFDRNLRPTIDDLINHNYSYKYII